MALNQTSRLAFKDCFDLLDRALESKVGIRVKQPTFGAAQYLRLRIHNARRIDREDNMMVYADQPDHIMYGRSVYDTIVVRVEKKGEVYNLRLEQVDKKKYEIEDIEEIEDGVDERNQGDSRADAGAETPKLAKEEPKATVSAARSDRRV